jgi:hypothetical protein
MSGSQKQFRCLTTGPTFARSDDLGEQYDFSKAKERTPPTPTRHFERSGPTLFLSHSLLRPGAASLRFFARVRVFLLFSH